MQNDDLPGQVAREINRQMFEVYSLTELVSVAKKLGVAERQVRDLEESERTSASMIRERGKMVQDLSDTIDALKKDLADRRKGDAAITALYLAAADFSRAVQAKQHRRKIEVLGKKLTDAMNAAQDHVDLIPF